jgi:type III secretory pathway component EscS
LDDQVMVCTALADASESNKPCPKPEILCLGSRAMIARIRYLAVAMDAPLLIGMVSACTALVASVVGPVVTLTVAKRQFNATAISGNRHKWIETLRDELAELIALLATALVVKSKWKDKWEEGRGPVNSDPVMLEKFERIVLAQSKIQLLLNPNEEDHEQLREIIDVAARRLRSEDALETATDADIGIIVSLAQAILKREWQRVKQGI